MKKIKLITGVALILFAMSFNLSILSNTDESDISLSSLINVPLANAESGGSGYETSYTYTFSETHTYQNGSGQTCTYTVSGTHTDCVGSGNVDCESNYESERSETTCS